VRLDLLFLQNEQTSVGKADIPALRKHGFEGKVRGLKSSRLA
jgi:hypothetical protein